MSQFRRYYRAAIRAAYNAGSKYYISSTQGALQDPTTLDGGRNLSRIIKPLLNLGNMSTELMQFMGYAGFPNPLPTITAGVNDLAGLDSRVSVLEKTQHVSSAITLALGPISDLLSAQQTMISNLNARTIVLEDEFYVPLNARTTAMQTTVEALGDYKDAARLNRIVRGNTPNGIMFSATMANSLNVIFSKYGWSGTPVASDSYLTQLQATFLIDNIFSNSTITPTTVEETQAWGVLIASMFKTGTLTKEQCFFVGDVADYYYSEDRIVSAELANAFNQIAPSISVVAGGKISQLQANALDLQFVAGTLITQNNLDSFKTIAAACSGQNRVFTPRQKNALRVFYKPTKLDDDAALSLSLLADDQEFLHALSSGSPLQNGCIVLGGSATTGNRMATGGSLCVNRARNDGALGGLSYIEGGSAQNTDGEYALGAYQAAHPASIAANGTIIGGQGMMYGGSVKNKDGKVAYGGNFRGFPAKAQTDGIITAGKAEVYGGNMVNQSNQTAWGAYMRLDPGSFVAGQPTRGNALIQGNRVTIGSDAGELSLLGSTFSTKNLQVLRALLTVLSGLSAGNHTINTADGNPLTFAVP